MRESPVPPLDRDGAGAVVPPARAWLIAAGIATTAGLLFASQSWLRARVRGADTPLAPLAAAELLGWYLWVALLPGIIAVARRWRVGEGDIARRLALQGTGALGFALAHALLTTLVDGAAHLGSLPLPARPQVAMRFTGDVFVCASIIAAYHALEYYGRYRQRERRAAQLERRLAQSRLLVLRMRLDPHFLFNALNTVGTLMHRDVDAADAMLTALADLLRQMLRTDDALEVPLRQEVEFVRRYLEIMRLRYGSRLRIAVDMSPDVLDALVPSLLLQPLVENALRHGVAARADGGWVEVRGERHEGTVRLFVRDDGPGLPAGWRADDGDGVGLRATRDRLRELYGTAQALELRNRPGGGLELSLRLPYRAAAAARSA